MNNILDSVQHKPNLVVNLHEDALPLQELYGHYFPAPAKGIYISGSAEPVITDGMYCYTLMKGAAGASQPVPVLGIQDITSAVYDIDAKILIPQEIAIRRMVATEPSSPFIQAKLIREIAFNTMQQNAKWYKGPKLSTREILSEYLKPQLDPSVTEDQLIELTDAIQEYTYRTERLVGQFMKGYEWCTYDLQLRGMDLWVMRGEDFRIKDWERRMKSGEW